MSAVAEHASEVRARGLGPLGVCSAVAFLLVALAVGVLVGPVDLGVGAVLESAAARLGDSRRLDVALADRGGDPLGDPRPARRPRRARRRDARARRGDLPGRLPQPARRSVPARRRGGRRASARRSRSRTSRTACAARRDAARRRLRRRRGRGDAHVRRRPLGAPRARRRDADPRRRHGDGLLHRVADLRPAAERRDAAGGLLLDPREHPEHRLGGRRPRSSRTSPSRPS